MIVLIDGYNLLRQVFAGLGECSKKVRSEFTNQLSVYACAHAATVKQVILVFDAGPFFHATREVRGGVVIMYAGQKSSADDWILDYLHKHKGGEFAVVSIDRALGRACKELGASVIDVHDFYRFVLSACAQRNAEKMDQSNDQLVDFDDLDSASMSHAQLDILMEMATANIRPKDDYLVPEQDHKKRLSNADKLSKKERKALATLKKLR